MKKAELRVFIGCPLILEDKSPLKLRVVGTELMATSYGKGTNLESLSNL